MARWGKMNGKIRPEHDAIVAPDGSPKSHRKWSKPCKAVVRAMLDGCAPNSAEARALLMELAEQNRSVEGLNALESWAAFWRG